MSACDSVVRVERAVRHREVPIAHDDDQPLTSVRTGDPGQTMRFSSRSTATAQAWSSKRLDVFCDNAFPRLAARAWSSTSFRQHGRIYRYVQQLVVGNSA